MNLKSAIKLLVSIVMLTLVIYSTNLRKLLGTLTEIPISVISLVIIGYAFGQVLSSLKWWLIVRSGGINIPYSTAFRAYFIGMFVNCFGLGMLGGDLARGLIVSYGQAKKTTGVLSVVADRLHGLAVLSLLALATTIVFGSNHIDSRLAFALPFFAASVISAWMIGPIILFKFFPESNPLRHKLENILAVFPRNPTTLALISSISLVFHLSQIALHRMMGVAFGVVMPWRIILVVVPFINILSSLPIAWQGLGVREKSYVFFLVPLLLTSEQAVAFGAMWLLAMSISSAIGGIIAALSPEWQSVKQARKEAQLETMLDSVNDSVKEGVS